MARKTKINRAPARNPYDTYLSWWFRYAKNNQMYVRQGDKQATPLDYTSFNRRYDQMRRANITNPARMVAMESREATEYQVRKTWEIVKNTMATASESDKEAYTKNIKRLLGSEKLTFQTIRKHYKEVFKTFMPYEEGDNPFLVDEQGRERLTEHSERDKAFDSPKEVKIAA